MELSQTKCSVGSTLMLTLMLTLVNCMGLETQASASPAEENSNYSRIQNTRFSGTWNIRLSAEKMEDETAQGNFSILGFRSELKYQLHPSLFLQFNPDLRFQSGQAQALYNDMEPTNQISISEALVNWQPLWLLRLQAGALNQNRLGNPLLVSDRPFPGAEIRFQLAKYDSFSSHIAIQETVPTSYTMESKVTDKEKTPDFSTQTLSTLFGKDHSFALFLTHYKFSNLPSIVAEKSLSGGNTVVGTNQFPSNFEGVSAGSELSFNFSSKIIGTLGANYIKNQKASEQMNSGHLLSAKCNWQISNTIYLEPYAKTFYNEPDTSPAYYNSFRLGNNNRQGQQLGFEIGLKKWGFKIRTEYIDSELIYIDPNQSQRQTYSLTLETFHENI